MTSIITNVKHGVRTTGLEHQGQNSISDPDQNLGFTCNFSSVMQEYHIRWTFTTYAMRQKCLSKFSAIAIDRWFAQTLYYNKSMINLAKTARRTSQDTFPSPCGGGHSFCIRSSATNSSPISIGLSQFLLHTQINIYGMVNLRNRILKI